ncbi:hypothetical protein AB834_03325 [PVC group bacterium (ex Bugula neritina AB1)]|nr:hypothetical protein AB834_03325 [PVC group bacterium (ex Bugula neritina AB1)]
MRNLFFVVAASILIIIFLSWNKKKEPSVREVNVTTLEERTQNKIKGLHEAAKAYEEGGEIQEALRTWREIVKTYPTDESTSEALFSLIKIYLDQKKRDPADVYFKKLEEGFPESKEMPKALYYRGQFFKKEGELQSSQKDYQRLVKNFFFFDKMSEVQKTLDALNMKLLFSKKVTAGTQIYQVQSGDSLSTIANKFNTPIDFLLQANGLKIDSVIHPRDPLKVFGPDVKVGVSVDKSQKNMLLMFNGTVLRRYDIAIGRNNSTLAGKFAVQNKLKDPVWFNAGRAILPSDPRNILGTRWLGFDRDMGIHGTIDKKHILDQTSNGCIRMNNGDVEQLYAILRVGDPVVIVE